MILQGLLLRNPDEAPVPGWIAIEADRIDAIGAGGPGRACADAGSPTAILCPGFVDAHVHLPQVDAIGCDGRDLLDWLDEVIFPAEATWADPAVAARQTDAAYRRLLRAGTLAYAGYLTSHPHGLAAVQAAHAKCPLRAIVGQSLVDLAAPPALLDQPVADLPSPGADGRLEFSVNPRYAVACTAGLLAEAGRRVRTGVAVQTHLSEQVREREIVRRLFPDCPHYTAVYDRAGLLGPRTLLAHGVHLEAEEWALIAVRQGVVVHCPAANTFLRSGLFDLDAAREHGVRLALGSDVAAGPDVAMPRVARAMIEVAKMRAMTVAPDAHVPTPAEAWRQITAGNADALGLDGAGRLHVGAPADLLVLDPPIPRDADLVGRMIYTWRDSYIAARVLGGKLLSEEATERRSDEATKGW